MLSVFLLLFEVMFVRSELTRLKLLPIERRKSSCPSQRLQAALIYEIHLSTAPQCTFDAAQQIEMKRN